MVSARGRERLDGGEDGGDEGGSESELHGD